MSPEESLDEKHERRREFAVIGMAALAGACLGVAGSSFTYILVIDHVRPKCSTNDVSVLVDVVETVQQGCNEIATHPESSRQCGVDRITVGAGGFFMACECDDSGCLFSDYRYPCDLEFSFEVDGDGNVTFGKNVGGAFLEGDYVADSFDDNYSGQARLVLKEVNSDIDGVDCLP